MIAKIRRYMISTTTLISCKQKWSLNPSQNTIHRKTPKTETGEALNGKTETEHISNHCGDWQHFN